MCCHIYGRGYANLTNVYLCMHYIGNIFADHKLAGKFVTGKKFIKKTSYPGVELR